MENFSLSSGNSWVKLSALLDAQVTFKGFYLWGVLIIKNTHATQSMIIKTLPGPTAPVSNEGINLAAGEQITINAETQGSIDGKAIWIKCSGANTTFDLTLVATMGIYGRSLTLTNYYNVSGLITPNEQTGDYTTVIADAGKNIVHPLGAGAGDVFTIAADADVEYDIGAAITFTNLAADDLDVEIDSDTLNYIDTGAVTTITIPQFNVVTAIKMTQTSWLASGSIGVTTV